MAGVLLAYKSITVECNVSLCQQIKQVYNVHTINNKSGHQLHKVRLMNVYLFNKC